MKVKILFALTFFCLVSQPLFAQNTKKMKLILGHPIDQSAVKSTAADKINILLYRTVYNFTAIVPFFDVLDPSIATNLPIMDNNLEAVAVSNQSDFIVYWSYKITGPQNAPQAEIRQVVWSLGAGKVVQEKGYTTKLDISLIDTIDLMLEDILKPVLNVGSIKVAFLQFLDFQIGKETYDLWINSKFISRVEGDSFSMKMKVLADQDYKIEMKQGFKAITNFTVHVLPGEAATISYKAAATVKLLPFEGKDSFKQYLALFDKHVLLEGDVWSGIPAGKEYLFELYELPTNRIAKKAFYLSDGMIKEINVNLKAFPRFYISAGLSYQNEHFTGSSLIHEDVSSPVFNIDLSYFITPAFWTGLYFNYSSGNDLSLSNTTDILDSSYMLGAEAGYLILGDQREVVKFGAGIHLGYSFFDTKINNINQKLFESQNINLGLFLNLNISWVQIRLYVISATKSFQLQYVNYDPANQSDISSDVILRFNAALQVPIF
ncbi:MAG: hypothetical protein HPY53_08120 [Brevinematales bacterium]|nr:hypothetical protein [Brevinematales bacterium]